MLKNHSAITSGRAAKWSTRQGNTIRLSSLETRTMDTRREKCRLSKNFLGLFSKENLPPLLIGVGATTARQRIGGPIAGNRGRELVGKLGYPNCRSRTCGGSTRSSLPRMGPTCMTFNRFRDTPALPLPRSTMRSFPPSILPEKSFKFWRVEEAKRKHVSKDARAVDPLKSLRVANTYPMVDCPWYADVCINLFESVPK